MVRFGVQSSVSISLPSCGSELLIAIASARLGMEYSNYDISTSVSIGLVMPVGIKVDWVMRGSASSLVCLSDEVCKFFECESRKVLQMLH